jgi:inhibitor of KinA
MQATVCCMKITPLGDAAILIEVGDDAAAVRNLALALDRERIAGVNDIVPAYTTVAIFYNPVRLTKAVTTTPDAAVRAWVESVGKTIAQTKATAGGDRVVPVCYGGEYGPDLEGMAGEKNMSIDDVVRLHSSTIYEVRAIGFSPGFPYLSGLPDALHMSRRATPRTAVPVGSVGIGGAQTGIYTLVTPGGWNLIGRTPLRLFRPESDEPAWLRVGDKVRIEPITQQQFESWSE